MIKKDNTSKQIRIYCLVVGIISFFIVSVCGQLLNRNTVNEEKMRAAFTAETTVNRIKSQLNRYLDVSEYNWIRTSDGQQRISGSVADDLR